MVDHCVYKLDGTCLDVEVWARLKPVMLEYVKSDLSVYYSRVATSINYKENEGLDFEIKFFA